MSEKNHFAALQEIRNWNTDDVICALKNNGLAECVDACKKRDISGEKLLELSEMKLGLWKRDLTIGNIRKLAAFIQDISKMPAKYTVCCVSSNSDDAWDTDFDDDDDDDEVEENGSQKTEINIPNGSYLERKASPSNLYQMNGILGAQNVANKNGNTQRDNRLSPVNRHSTSQMRNKINIPSAFASGHIPQNGSTTNLSVGNVTKPPFLKANGTTEQVRKEEPQESQNLKPIVPLRPPSLYMKSSLQENTTSTLPKPPAFDNEGLVLRDIWDRLPLEPDLMDEYESIDDDLLHARSMRNQTSLSNGKGSSSSSMHQNTRENLRKSPVPHSPGSDANQQVSLKSTLHQNQLYISQKINTLTQQTSKVDQENVIENIKKSPIPPSGYKRQEGTIQITKSMSSVNQEKEENLRRSPVPLPPRNEVKQISPNSSTLHLTHQVNSYRLNEGLFTTESAIASKISKDYDDSRPREVKHESEIDENMHCEEVYESIPEHVSTHCGRIESCEYSEGYLLPKAPPSLPPKPKQTSNIKSPVKANKAESNGTSGSLWTFGSQKHKSQQIVQEKSTQDGKKNNTLPMPHPMNSYVSEAPRPPASRPLPPPPPPDGGVQRVIKIPLVQMPWYFNVDRTRGEEILRNCEDGTFMIRPSTKTQNALTLTLKYGKRPFNICVRHRPDGKFALGTAKPTEQTFSSVEELVNHYMSNELLLYSNGKQAGIVVLSSPPRKDQ